MVGSSLSYAAGNVYARRNVRGLRPMIPALFQVGFAAAIIVPLALIVDDPFTRVHPAPEAFLAIAWLGILGSGFAYLCYFTIMANWGATRKAWSCCRPSWIDTAAPPTAGSRSRCHSPVP